MKSRIALWGLILGLSVHHLKAADQPAPASDAIAKLAKLAKVQQKIRSCRHGILIFEGREYLVVIPNSRSAKPGFMQAVTDAGLALDAEEFKKVHDAGKDIMFNCAMGNYLLFKAPQPPPVKK